MSHPLDHPSVPTCLNPGQHQTGESCCTADDCGGNTMTTLSTLCMQVRISAEQGCFQCVLIRSPELIEPGFQLEMNR